MPISVLHFSNAHDVCVVHQEVTVDMLARDVWRSGPEQLTRHVKRARETRRQTDRQTDGQIDRQTDIDKETNKQTDRQTDR